MSHAHHQERPRRAYSLHGHAQSRRQGSRPTRRSSRRAEAVAAARRRLAQQRQDAPSRDRRAASVADGSRRAAGRHRCATRPASRRHAELHHGQLAWGAHGYAYAWYVDGVAREGASSATYAVQPDDVGHSAACVVTATNAHGDTTAPMSNAVTVA